MIDGMHERVCMTVHEFPTRLCGAAEYPRHAQRPVLFQEVPDRSVLSLDDDENRQVTRRIRLHHIDRRLAATEEPRQAIQRCVGLWRGALSCRGGRSELKSARTQRLVGLIMAW